MAHFKLEDWADFARGILHEEQYKSMELHLNTGCESCKKLVNIWQRVHSLGKQDLSYTPPDSAVRSVKGMFGLHAKRRVRSKAASAARLLFDSFRQPQLAGVRAAASPVRQLLYGAGEYQVDLRIELRKDCEGAVVVGQILHAEDPDHHLAGVSVELVKAGKVKSGTVSNGFGEFRLECDLSTGLHLRFTLPSNAEFRVPVVEPTLASKSKVMDLSDSIGLKRPWRVPGKGTRKKV